MEYGAPYPGTLCVLPRLDALLPARADAENLPQPRCLGVATAAALPLETALLAVPDTPLLPVLGPGDEMLGIITRRNVLGAHRSSIDLVSHAPLQGNGVMKSILRMVEVTASAPNRKRLPPLRTL